MIVHGDCLEVMAGLEPESVASVVTDPPYGLGFMGKAWDGTAGPGGLGDVPMRRRAEDQPTPHRKRGRWLCFGLHRWEHRKWGAVYFNLDCRTCLQCRTFEVYAYGSWHRRDRAEFEPTVLAERNPDAKDPGELLYRPVANP